MFNRWERCSWLTCSLLLLMPCSMLRGQAVRASLRGEAANSSDRLITPATDRAINAALDYLVKHQNRDGSFGGGIYGRNVGVCSLVGIAFLASGSTPERGPYGQTLQRCVNYVSQQIQESGFINAREAESHGPMYSHGFATLFLCEVQGMVPGKDLRRKLTRSVRLIVASQNNEGGWRYQPQKRDADISVTICEVMALRAARNAGFYVPAKTIDRATDYIRRCQNPDGGFMYSLSGGESALPRSSGGVVALYSAGIYEGDELDRGLAYVRKNVVSQRPGAVREYYFYGQYYTAQAMWLAGEDDWRAWYPRARDAILAQQRPDGAWSDPISREYAAAMAAIVLQMPNDMVPIFQR